jgi:HK97 gp10 family phage protein
MAREVVRLEGLAGVLDVLKQLPPEMVSKAGGPVKLALKEGAAVLLAEAKQNVRLIIDTPNKNGENDSTGLLLLSLQSRRTKPPQGKRGEASSVAIRRNQKYPANRQSKKGDTTAAQIGRQLEFGTEKRPPMPWMRPAFDVKGGEAARVFVEGVNRRTEALVKKLERQARRG